MDKNIFSLRQLQRNYRKLINQTKRTKKPIYLGAYSKAEAVLLDVDSFEDLQANNGRKEKSWKELKKTLDWIKSQGRTNVNLAKFIHEDRKRH